MSENILKKMVSEAIGEGEPIEPSVIANRINRKYTGVRVSEKSIKDFLEEQYYADEEIKRLEQRHKGFNGFFYV